MVCVLYVAEWIVFDGVVSVSDAVYVDGVE